MHLLVVWWLVNVNTSLKLFIRELEIQTVKCKFRYILYFTKNLQFIQTRNIRINKVVNIIFLLQVGYLLWDFPLGCESDSVEWIRKPLVTTLVAGTLYTIDEGAIYLCLWHSFWNIKFTKIRLPELWING